LLFVPLLASLFHGGFPPYSNPIFRSGEVCRHSKINNPQDISLAISSCSLFSASGFCATKYQVQASAFAVVS